MCMLWLKFILSLNFIFLLPILKFIKGLGSSLHIVQIMSCQEMNHVTRKITKKKKGKLTNFNVIFLVTDSNLQLFFLGMAMYDNEFQTMVNKI